MRSTTMFGTSKHVSLFGIALVLAACAETGSSSPGTGSDDTAKGAGSDAPTSAEAKQRTEARDSLKPVASSATERRQRTSNLAADARAFANSVAARAGVVDPRFVDFSIKSADGQDHVRLEQRTVIGGEELRVWGADVVIHADQGSLFGLTGSMSVNAHEALDPRMARSADSVDAARALQLAKADRFGAAAGSVTTTREDSERIVYMDHQGTPHVSIHTTFYNELVTTGGKTFGPGLWNHIYDEATGELLASWNGIDTISQASGPGGNPKYTHSWSDELDVESQGAGYVMTTSRLHTTNMNNSQSGGGSAVTASSLSSFNDAAINDAHGYAEITLNMLSEWMGHNSIDDNGFRIVSRVHYGTQYENAFWDGSQMTYGDGKTYFYALSGAVDVVAHEIDHGFTSKHSNLAYSGEPGGLNEGFSDIAGKTAEWYYKGTANFDLGGDIFKSDGALRYMCDPRKDGRSIDNAAQMTASLDPHYSSGVPNKAFCRLAKRLSSGSADGNATRDGVHRAASAFFKANANYWTSSTTFNQACQGTVDAARAAGFTTEEVAAIKDSWLDVGVYCDGATPPPPPCDVTLTNASGELTSPNFPNAYGNNFSKTWCIDAPAGQSVTLTFTDFETESGYDYVTLRDKAGTQLSKTAGSTAPAAVTSSRVYVVFNTDSSVTKKGWRATWTSQ